MRLHYDDPPVTIPPSGWQYTSSSGTAIQLLPDPEPRSSRARSTSSPTRPRIHSSSGSASPPSATSPTSCATPAPTASGNANPLAGDVQEIYTFCYSQPCRFMHDFVRLGFNQTEAGGRAVDGVLNWVGGASGGFFNYRFAQPGRTMRQHIGRWYPGAAVPVREPGDHRPGDGADRRRPASLPGERHLPEDLRGQLRERVLEQGRLAAHDRHPGQRPRPRCHAERALLPPVEPAARRRERARASASSSRTRSLPNPALRALLVDLDQWVAERHRAAAQPGADAVRTGRSCRRCRSRRRVPGDPRGDLQRAHDHRRPVRLRAHCSARAS